MKFAGVDWNANFWVKLVCVQSKQIFIDMRKYDGTTLQSFSIECRVLSIFRDNVFKRLIEYKQSIVHDNIS